MADLQGNLQQQEGIVNNQILGVNGLTCVSDISWC